MPLLHHFLLPHPPLAGPSTLVGAITGLTLFVASIVLVFSRSYMRADPRRGVYFRTVSALVASVLAFVGTGNMVVFACAWLASGMALAQLIGRSEHLPDAHLARWRAHAAFLIGDGALVGALAILGWYAGSVRIDAALAATAGMPAPMALLTALLLVIAAAARSALPPFAGWLLSSMTAPTPVSALMHAGLVNAGGFLLIRFAPALEASPLARIVAMALGLFAALYGIGIMAVRPDIKRSLAGSTVSQMGFMIFSCGLGAYAAALWHIVAHGLFKAWLFLGSGSTIGMKAGGAGRGSDARTPCAIAALTLAIALAAAWAGALIASMVPLALALATGLATLAAALQGPAPPRGKIALALSCIGLVALYAGALHITHAAMRPDAPALLPPSALLALLAGFLGAWVWQQRLLSGAAPLPRALYVHLLNSGALAMPAKGAAQ